MRISALLICEHSDQKWNTVDVTGAPKYVFDVSGFPAKLRVPVTAIVWSAPGEDSEAMVQIVCLTEDLTVLGGHGNQWIWPDQTGILTKYHVFSHGVDVTIAEPGLYYIGLAGEAIQGESIYVPFQVQLQTPIEGLEDPFKLTS